MADNATAPRTVPFLGRLSRHHRVPVHALEEAGAEAGGRVVRLDMGPFRPYLVTHPDHVEHVLTVRQPNYVRAGMFWDPLAPLLGESILSDGENWADSRRILQPLFAARHLNAMAENMARIMDELIETTVVPGRPFDVTEGMGALVHPVIVRLFFGAKISMADIDRLAPAYDVAVTAKALRLVLPFVPHRVPLPGDRAFRRAIKTIDEVVYPCIARARHEEGDDVISRLVRARADDGGDRRIRDDLVAMHGASTETTSTAMSWVWPTLQAHPEIAAKVYEEVDRVVGDEPAGIAHLPHLRYLKMFVSELLRVYPPGWLLPRRTVEADVVGGVGVEAGSTVILSPYLTHRLPEFWDRPATFDPGRFAPGGDTRRHRYAYWPFAAGPHVCLGQHLFALKAPLLIAGILRRYRPHVHLDRPIVPRLASTLRPPHGLTMTLEKRR
ncbi:MULTISPECIES: cytochrome P450 [unclassified Nonomuraea]|uniref:cytochrome P450 n=1 Tax=unclassified Nonomuraea TaxID=2593643 RepID=UPI0033D6ED04